VDNDAHKSFDAARHLSDASPGGLGITPGTGLRLETHDLAIGYRGRLVGSGISLALDAGEVLCLLGPNGAGKTTLFRTLLGLLPPLGGMVAIGGEPLGRMRPIEIAKRMAYVPQAHVTEFSYTVLDLVVMGRTARLGPFASPSAEDERIARAKLADLGIGDLAGADYTRISGGQRQLVLIARALAQGAPLLVMDEPTASLDFGNQGRVMHEILALKASGHGVLFTTHDPNHAMRTADRVYLLRQGERIAEGVTGTILDRPHLEALYGTPVELITDHTGRTMFLPG
jgi:iron complex transport system ATP-binding protein